MRVAVTGTPGTGKTTATERLETDLEVVHLNDLVREEGLTTGEDPERGSLVVDLEAVADRLAGREDVLVESHLAHHLDVDRVIVLRCHPERLRERLLERGESQQGGNTGAGSAEPPRTPNPTVGETAESAEPPRTLPRKARENAEAEALDVVLAEAVDEHGLETVYEIDTTDRDPGAVAGEIEAVLDGEREPSAGEVDYLGYL
jgi:adenylate kinase